MIKKIIIAFLLWKAFLIGVALFSSNLIVAHKDVLAINSSFPLPYWQWIWGNFDGVNYVEIARAGYQYPNYAYFPLYPFLISIGRQVLAMKGLTVGLIISNTSIILSLFLIYRITRLDFDKATTFRTIILLLAFPTAFFYGTVYADSLYLFLSTASFYFARMGEKEQNVHFARKSQWLWAGIFGYLAGLCRLVGIVLLPALLVEWYMQRKSKKQKPKIKTVWKAFLHEHVFFLLLIPLAFLTYGIYLQFRFGDFFLFQKSMAPWDQSRFVFPLQVIYRYLHIFVTAQPSFTYFIAVCEFVATIAYFALSIYVIKKVRLSYGIFMLLTLLIPTFTGTFQSMPRYILHLFPAFIGLALLSFRSKMLYWSTVLIFLILQAIFVVFFTHGYFVA